MCTCEYVSICVEVRQLEHLELSVRPLRLTKNAVGDAKEAIEVALGAISNHEALVDDLEATVLDPDTGRDPNLRPIGRTQTQEATEVDREVVGGAKEAVLEV